MEGTDVLNDAGAHTNWSSRGIAHVPENRRLFPRNCTIEENLEEWARSCHKRPRPHFAERLARVYQLFPRMEGAPHTNRPARLSGGEQQMCAIGRALMSGPEAAVARRTLRGTGACGGAVRSSKLVRRYPSAEGYTVLIVEQNIQPGAQSGRPRLSARSRLHSRLGHDGGDDVDRQHQAGVSRGLME